MGFFEWLFGPDPEPPKKQETTHVDCKGGHVEDIREIYFTGMYGGYYTWKEDNDNKTLAVYGKGDDDPFVIYENLHFAPHPKYELEWIEW